MRGLLTTEFLRDAYAGVFGVFMWGIFRSLIGQYNRLRVGGPVDYGPELL